MGEKPTAADEEAGAAARAAGRPRDRDVRNERAGAAIADIDRDGPPEASLEPGDSIAIGEEGLQRSAGGGGGGIAIDEEGVQRSAMNSIRNMQARSAGGPQEGEAAQRTNLNSSKSNVNREADPDDAGTAEDPRGNVPGTRAD